VIGKSASSIPASAAVAPLADSRATRHSPGQLRKTPFATRRCLAHRSARPTRDGVPSRIADASAIGKRQTLRLRRVLKQHPEKPMMEKSNEVRGPDAERPDPRERRKAGRGSGARAVEAARRSGTRAKRTRLQTRATSAQAQEAVRFVGRD